MSRVVFPDGRVIRVLGNRRYVLDTPGEDSREVTTYEARNLMGWPPLSEEFS
jgi:hypothetical protein